MRKYLTICFFLFCAGSSFAQSPVSLNEAVRTAAVYLDERLSDETIIAVLNIQSNFPKLSNYIINGLTEQIVNNSKFRTVERNLSQLHKELAFQASGMVSDSTAQSIGQLWGAQVIVSGSFVELGGRYQLTVKALVVETGEILGMRTVPVYMDATLSALMRSDNGKRSKSPRFFINGDESWKHKWIYPGIRLGVSPHSYQLNTSSNLEADNHAAFEAALSGELQIAKLFAIQPEIVYSADTVSANNADIDVTINTATLTIPILAKLTFRPGNFYLAGFAGPYFSFPLGAMAIERNGTTESYSYTAPMGINGGVDVGVKLGQGVLFLDLRYSADLSYFWANDSAQFTRSMFSVSLGYNYGFINKAVSGGRK
jgi:TolB-like protein